MNWIREVYASGYQLMNCPKILLVLLLGFVPLLAFGCKKAKTKEEMLSGLSEESRRALDAMTNTPFLVEGTSSPEFMAGSESRLKDDAEVIGVVVEGQARAYPITRLSAMTSHIVNDSLLGKDGNSIAFTVTYCDITDNARVLEPSLEQSDAALDIGTLGLLDGGLALRWQDKQFKQMDAIEGLKDMPFERRRWADWKSEFPDTLLYVGRVNSSR